VTLFTGSWVAHLLGYGRKHRGSKLIETFTAVAVRSYLLVHHFVPLSLVVKGPFANFNFFWRQINTPASQVFFHPIAATVLWDVRAPRELGRTKEDLAQWLSASLLEFGSPDVAEAAPLVLEQALKDAVDLWAGLGATSAWRYRQAAYRFSWASVFFAPTRLSRPRRAKKARSIRKRLAKRLVRAAGRRFWV